MAQSQKSFLSHSFLKRLKIIRSPLPPRTFYDLYSSNYQKLTTIRFCNCKCFFIFKN